MKKQMLLIFAACLAATPLSRILYAITGVSLLYSLVITFCTFSCHLGMRLAAGGILNAGFHNHMNYRRSWFQERPFERHLYKILRVKKWKQHIPTFTPREFHLSGDSIEHIVQVTCQAEVVHEINMVLSFVPILFSIWAKDLWVFVITSCAACLLDGVFVVVQRYNRPRLLRLLK